MTNPTPLGWGFIQRTDSALAKNLVKCAAKANFRLIYSPQPKGVGLVNHSFYAHVIPWLISFKSIKAELVILNKSLIVNVQQL